MTLSNLTGEIVKGGATLLGLPAPVQALFAAAATSVLGAYQAQRLGRAKDILVRQLKRGKYWAITDDQTAAALWTYLRAAEEGAARRNLEAMAEALTNAAQEPTFAPNTFRRHSSNLASLTREEAHALAIFIDVRQKRLALGTDGPKEPNDWTMAYEIATNGSHIFHSIEDFQAVAVALLRTGYVKPLSLYGSMGYGPTLILDEIARLVDLDDVLARSDADGIED